MKTLPILLLLAAAAAPAQDRDPAKQLFDSAIRAEQLGRLDAARDMFEVLSSAYAGNPLAARAGNELDAIDLYLEGQARLQAGKPRSASITFRTLLQVYPESPLAARAEAAGRVAEQQAPGARAPLVKAIEFKGKSPVGAAEILERFDEREINLAVERPLDPQGLAEARIVLRELLAERGESRARVKAETHSVSPHAVAVVFKSQQGSRLRSMLPFHHASRPDPPARQSGSAGV